MVIDIKLSRLEDVAWGFRLAGGIDYDLPLTVTKVVPGSIAEKCGLKEKDIIVRINDTSTINLGHFDVHEIIMGCANNFVFGVSREGENDDIKSECPNEFSYKVESSVSDGSYEIVDEKTLFGEVNSPDTHSIVSEITVYSNGAGSHDSDISQRGPKPYVNTLAQPVTNIIKTEEDPTEVQIAEIMSGEAEVLKEHNVLGINFQRIIPKANIFKSSEVFKTLNEEAMKTKTDKENEVKKWTTFLQKPNRPIPKSKFDLEIERRVPYKVNIVKQPKPKCDPNRAASPSPSTEIEIIQEAPVEQLNGDVASTETKQKADEVAEVAATEECVCDCENPQAIVDEVDHSIVEDGFVHTPPAEETSDGGEVEVKDIQSAEENEYNAEVKSNPIFKSAEDILLEKQLANVQKQLQTLSNLPTTIQATLDAVAKQLEDLIPAIQRRTSVSTIDAVQPVANDEAKINDEIDETQGDEVELDSGVDEEVAVACNNGPELTIQQSTQTAKENDEQCESTTDEEIAKLKTEKTFRKQEEDWIKKREKERKQLTMEQQQRLIVDQLSQRPVRPINGGPRTPQERPLVLPGGRKWRNAKDAYNEEFIAEIISSQAELIVGSTLGHTFESPLLGYDDRVNFLKYKKPEKDLSNLNKSEVFKIIHHMESEPRNGIPARPEKVVAAADVLRSATPMVCK